MSAVVDVEMENSSWVEGRGVRHTAWSMRVGDEWVELRELRDVRRTMTAPEFSFADDVDELRVLPPGCQYRVTFHLRVPVGARFQKRVSVPRAHKTVELRGDMGEDDVIRRLVAAFPPIKMPLRTTFVEYRLVRAHKLVTEKRWQRWLQRRNAKEPQS